MRPELSQDLLDILYGTLDEKFHEEIYALFLDGERQKQEYKEFYYGLMWEKKDHATGPAFFASRTS